MDRQTLLWTLVAFFGASILFRAVQTATEDESTAVTVGLEVLVLVAIVGLIVLISRRRRN
jgi:membrane protein DedA with SNARE-associated domain